MADTHPAATILSNTKNAFKESLSLILTIGMIISIPFIGYNLFKLQIISYARFFGWEEYPVQYQGFIDFSTDFVSVVYTLVNIVLALISILVFGLLQRLFNDRL